MGLSPVASGRAESVAKEAEKTSPGKQHQRVNMEATYIEPDSPWEKDIRKVSTTQAVIRPDTEIQGRSLFLNFFRDCFYALDHIHSRRNTELLLHYSFGRGNTES